MRQRVWLILLLIVLVLGATFVWAIRERSQNTEKPSQAALPAPCHETFFENGHFIVCTVEQHGSIVSLHLNDQNHKPWGTLRRFAAETKPLFAMNAGMYHDDLSPVGLFVEHGKQVSPLNMLDGAGNFFMKPNGVFGVLESGAPFVIRTEDFVRKGMKPAFATQSGPMLVIDGVIHSRFEPDGASRHIRNGVGIDNKGRAVFAISRESVSFGKIARLFRERFNCQNALYFDGVVSAFAQNEMVLQGGTFPTGPIVAVFPTNLGS